MGEIEPIDRIAYDIGPITIYWYGILIGIGMLLGWILAARESKKVGMEKELLSDLLLWAIPTSIICARLYYVIFKWEYYIKNPGDIFAIWEGGIAIHGGLLGAVITAVIFSRKQGISFWRLADIAAPSIILGQAIGRWGNFINQEAYGGEVSRSFLESLLLPDLIINQMYIEGAYYHPTFLYESLWNILGFVLLIFIRRLPIKRGEVFLSYIIWYSVGRYFVEGLRTDSLMLTESVRIAQAMSLTLIVAAVLVIVLRKRLGKAVLRYADRN
ncbi:prolipoprotein diacylglyceryl transferase (plasmid) [Cytobacillus firmus]|uniref:prolipoprotein diacylglyceryl transferase n=1 Tax=Cytobacillus firmus TaxID=1399 RepID=UPI002079B286|nr:prolipoprotein diacylglyceryl transferase [Cytobacillus firmus]USK41574.1 prolipoprotein diacylglyceryl transferase [Cytobacillus firmus]